MNKYIFIILALVIIFYSCQSKQCIVKSIIPIEGNNVIIKKINQCKNMVISEEENIRYNKDSLIETGYYKEYFENGEIKEFGFLNNGNPDSIYIKYYLNGSKEIEYYRWHCQASGAQYTYFPNGNIESMIFCKNDSVPLFALNYNQNGLIKKKQGSAVHLVLQPDYQNIKVGQSLGIANLICLYRNTQGSMNIQFMRNYNLIWDTTIREFKYQGRIPFYLFNKKIKKSGVYRYRVNAKIINDKSNLIKLDTEEVIIRVKP